MEEFIEDGCGEQGEEECYNHLGGPGWGSVLGGWGLYLAGGDVLGQ